jgi:hypothetical protein
VHAENGPLRARWCRHSITTPVSQSISKQARRDRKRREAIAAHPRRLAHETMMLIAPPWARAVRPILERLRPSPGASPVLVAERHLAEDAGFNAMLDGRFALETQGFGWDCDTAHADVQCLCTLAECAINYEIGGRKAFWVDGGLAELLAQTTLDISGDVLKLPFPSCAFLFDDPRSLALAEAVRNGAASSPLSSPYRMLTVYVFPIPIEHGEPGIKFVFLADAFDGQWPYLVTREVPLDGKRNLDEILRSHPDHDEPPDPFFELDEVRALLHLAVNAVLYATSRELVSEVRRPPSHASLGPRGKPLELSGETVFYLPSRIVIGPRNAPDDRPFGTTGPVIEKRFWVRGHWRKANPTWQDQRLRWIAPYLKGPEMTAIIERAYELKGNRSSDGS